MEVKYYSGQCDCSWRGGTSLASNRPGAGCFLSGGTSCQDAVKQRRLPWKLNASDTAVAALHGNQRVAGDLVVFRDNRPRGGPERLKDGDGPFSFRRLRVAPGMAGALQRCINVADFRALTRRRMPQPIVDFFDGGAEDEQTMARNRAAFADWMLIPATMRDVSRIDASATILGQRLAWPFIVGPTGMPGLLHPDGEIGIARAADQLGALYTLSTMASRSIEEVAAATTGPKAFQLYLFRDRGLTRELIQRARAAGYVALVLTVDVQVPANRERDRRSGMTIPPKLGLRSMVQFARHPGWCWNVLVKRPVTLANFAGRRADPGVPLLQFINEQFDPAITWQDLEWVAKQWNGPLAIKGIMNPDDAQQAVAHGVDGIILSNHGGRQLDGGAAPLDLLPAIADRLAGSTQIILDGGVRRGTDMMKALALGADGCMAGRVGLYGLGAGGGEGARLALKALKDEFERDLALLGVTRIADITRERIMAGSDGGLPDGPRRTAMRDVRRVACS